MAAPTIVRVRSAPGGVDQYGDPTAGASTEVVLPDAFLAPRTSEELTANGRAGVIVGWTLFAPYDTDLVFTDQVKVDGVLYQIEGEPGRWRNPFTGWEPGLQAALTRVEG